MQQNDNKNFLDSRTLLAIVLVGVVWFGWQSYINQKYPQTVQSESTSQQTLNNQAVQSNSIPQERGDQVNDSLNSKSTLNSESVEKLIPYENDNLKLQISSQGLSIKNVNLKSYSERDNSPVSFNTGKVGNFETFIFGKLIPFNLEQKSQNEFVGTFSNENYVIIKKLTFSGYSILSEISLETKNPSIPLPEIKNSINDIKRITGKSSFLAPSLETQDLMLVHSDGSSTNSLYREGNDLDLVQTKISLVSLSSHYFAAAVIDKSEVIPEFIINHKFSDEIVNAFLIYRPISNDTKTIKIKYSTYMGPKDMNLLESADPRLAELINFGWFSAIAKPMLITMKWFFNMTGNWGLAIILLTLLVRLIVMPLHIMSFRSMKTMQKIQPMIKSLREKYKDDALALNREMMDLMKKNKVNPLSGCLPMFLQIPVFFALYRVFGQSIELYKSPFIFWIKDLSILDPFYVLPILMAIVMYLQQKMTPSTMDPAQAKMMQFLPLVFSFMMISLPSALTLYIFVSTLFGIIQQFLFLKEKNALAVNVAKV